MQYMLLTGVTASEADAVDSGVHGQEVTNLRALASDQVQDTLGNTSLVEHLHHVDACNAALGRGLQDDHVTSHQGWTNLGDSQVDRVVEGGDGQDDAQGNLWELV